MIFYQSIDLPGGETHAGQWDHRATADVYLAHTDFHGKTVLEVGPGSGFWSFELERRGGIVTALELGHSDQWDMIPHGGSPSRRLLAERAASVSTVTEAFWYSHDKLRSSVSWKSGNIYEVPKLVPRSDMALLGNILQHLRDPLLGIERVALTVTERIIISETLWIEDPEFLSSPRMHFLPRAEVPAANHSWYQVSPALIVEWLKILGFREPSVEFHEQQFLGIDTDPQARMVKHFTCAANRSNVEELPLL